MIFHGTIIRDNEFTEVSGEMSQQGDDRWSGCIDVPSGTPAFQEGIAFLELDSGLNGFIQIGAHQPGKVSFKSTGRLRAQVG